MTQKNYIACFFLCLTFTVFGADGGKDTNYIKPFKHSIALTLATSSKFLNVKLYNATSGHDLLYSPAPFFTNGFELDNSVFSFGYNPGFMAINGKKSKYGDADHSSFRLSFSLWAFYTELDLQFYRGYYLSNTKSYQEFANSGLFQQADMFTMYLGTNIYYTLNHKKFAFTAPVNYNAMQIKSAGSTLLGLSSAFSLVSNPNGLVPAQIKSYFDTTRNVKLMNYSFITLNGGYGYNFAIKKKFYISIAELIGFGISQFNYEQNEGEVIKLKNRFALQNFTRFGAGFNNGSWYVGVNLFYQNFYNFELKNTMIEFDKVSFKVFFGKLLYLKPCKNKKADNFFTALGF